LQMINKSKINDLNYLIVNLNYPYIVFGVGVEQVPLRPPSLSGRDGYIVVGWITEGSHGT